MNARVIWSGGTQKLVSPLQEPCVSSTPFLYRSRLNTQNLPHRWPLHDSLHSQLSRKYSISYRCRKWHAFYLQYKKQSMGVLFIFINLWPCQHSQFSVAEACIQTAIQQGKVLTATWETRRRLEGTSPQLGAEVVGAVVSTVTLQSTVGLQTHRLLQG